MIPAQSIVEFGKKIILYRRRIVQSSFYYLCMIRTREQLKHHILSSICDNGKERITANRLCDILIDIVDNMYTKEDIINIINEKSDKEQIINIKEKENIDNKVTTISEDSTDDQYPSARAVYDYVKLLQDSKDVEDAIKYYAAEGYIRRDVAVGELTPICKSKSGKFSEEIIFSIGIGHDNAEIGDNRKKNSFFITDSGKIFALNHNIVGGKTYLDIFDQAGADQYIRLA